MCHQRREHTQLTYYRSIIPWDILIIIVYSAKQTSMTFKKYSVTTSHLRIILRLHFMLLNTYKLTKEKVIFNNKNSMLNLISQKDSMLI